MSGELGLTEEDLDAAFGDGEDVGGTSAVWSSPDGQEWAAPTMLPAARLSSPIQVPGDGPEAATFDVDQTMWRTSNGVDWESSIARAHKVIPFRKVLIGVSGTVRPDIAISLDGDAWQRLEAIELLSEPDNSSLWQLVAADAGVAALTVTGPGRLEEQEREPERERISVMVVGDGATLTFDGADARFVLQPLGAPPLDFRDGPPDVHAEFRAGIVDFLEPGTDIVLGSFTFDDLRQIERAFTSWSNPQTSVGLLVSTDLGAWVLDDLESLGEQVHPRLVQIGGDHVVLATSERSPFIRVGRQPSLIQLWVATIPGGPEPG